MKSNMFLGGISIFLLLTLSACTQSEYGNKFNFYGTSNSWVVKYDTEISEAKGWADFSFEYIGEEAAPEMFGYNLKSTWFELISEEERFNDQENNISSGNSECTGRPINNISCAVIIENDEIMEAKIEWNGNSEVIVLTRQ